jgi:3-oxoacyl-[acyl-carrier-protein] synthase III
LPFGLSAVSVYRPPWGLDNHWFGSAMPRKFVHHTGIERRCVAWEDEVTLGLRAVRQLQQQVGCDLKECVALVFVSPSFVPLPLARHYLGPEAAEQERLQRAARQLARRLGMTPAVVAGLNWFCSGYSRAMEVVGKRILPRIELGERQFLLVVTASRISRITDYACLQTAGLFGDLATATLISRVGDARHPAHFEVLYAAAQTAPAEGVYFDFRLKHDVPRPEVAGGVATDPQRLVYWLDGMAIADAAPRAMAQAVGEALAATGVATSDVGTVIPHQAGTGIVKLTEMKLQALGLQAEVLNGLTREVGNVSSCSIPFALEQRWNQLRGTIVCPTAAVGRPGRAELLRGCLVLRATKLHERQSQAAA